MSKLLTLFLQVHHHQDDFLQLVYTFDKTNHLGEFSENKNFIIL